MLRHALLASTAAAALAAGPAAAITAAPVQNGCAAPDASMPTVIVCAANDADGFAGEPFENGDDLDVTVEQGVTVSSETDAVDVDDDATILNEGVIQSTGNFVDDGEGEDDTSDAAIDADDDLSLTNRNLIDGAERGVEADKDAEIVNTGEIKAGSGDAINLGEGGRVENGTESDFANARIQSGGDEGVQGEDGLTVVNRGVIDADDKAIDTEGFDDLTVENSGTILSGDKGVRAGDDDGEGGSGLTLTNSGEIAAGDEAVETGDDATITNSGTIRTTRDDAVQVGANATIVNAGDILGGETVEGDGVDIDGGAITNSGTIEARVDVNADGDIEAGVDVDEGDATLSIVNSGRIAGGIGVLTDAANTGVQTVVNAGEIEGRVAQTAGAPDAAGSKLAVSLGAGDDLVELQPGGVFIGDVDFGAGADRLLLSGPAPGYLGGGASDLPLYLGGSGVDTIVLPDEVDLSALSIAPAPVLAAASVGAAGFSASPILTLALSLTGGDATLDFVGFERIEVAGRLFAADPSLAPIPLPAGAPLLLGGLAALGAAARRRRG